MTGAMYAAVSGLRAHMSALNVIGQNISNVNTNAYKATRYTFLEALYTTVRGGSNGSAQLGGKNPAQMGYGTSIGTIDLDMSTKNYVPTGRATDVMIDGDGFLIVGNKGQTFTSTQDLKNMYLTRHGDLAFDNQGYLTDGMGNVVYGFMSVANPVYEKAFKDDAGNAITPPTLTNADLVVGNVGKFYLNADGELVTIVNKGTDANPSLETKVIDQYTPHPVLTAIRLPKAGTGAFTQGDPNDPDAPKTQLYSKGQPVYAHYDEQSGTIVDAQDDADVSGRIEPDSVSIDENTGRITCTAGGKAVVIGTIAIAKVQNPNGVTHVNGRYYQALEGAGEVSCNAVGGSVLNTDDPDSPFYEEPANPGDPVTKVSGEIPVGAPGSTKFITGGLESSGTDLANEISNMITIQRGYQANTRIVTVTDSMLEELVNMKR
ncbi:flagellar hook-basal body complex protein [Oscillospiraceae bacterium 42-9]